MGTQPRNNETLCFYGGTEMTSQDNLRDRMAEVLSRTYTSGQAKVVLEDIAAAQAIIEEVGLTNQWSFRFAGEDARIPLHRPEDIRTIGLYGPLEDAVIEARTVGKWEEQ